ncbi:YjiH family protein [Oceanimonas sp. CHS3-5]|uniref:YjiH family protein n=1 Tax=Oceanimonas sp. CHS3-5 TaxID=3068186 RepID=UPI00273E5747|nr:YjiH family protein [Oceanimonas sp. CHS3-5]MDP5291079.1 YjiH family protein [Oceanimonas sp. CHS3-5]
MEKALTARAGGTRNWLMFLLPSLAGVLLFMTPVAWQGNLTIMIAVLAKSVQAMLGEQLPAIVTGLITLSALLSLLGTLVKPAWLLNSAFLNTLFNVRPVWLISRLLGAVFVLLVHFKAGPELLYSGDTGGLVLNDLLPVLFSVFIFAGLLLPLLLDFGLLELVGTLLTGIMRPLFRLPGRSAVDCMASWLGDGSVGILLTSKQYEGHHYTQREAAVIGTTFSAVSITFSLVVLAQVKLEHMFLPFYGAVCLAGIVAAVVVPRLPPLCWKKDTFINGEARPANAEATPDGYSRFGHGLKLALARAGKVEGLAQVARAGVHNALDMLLGVLPVVMAFGTLALVVAETTPLFSWLGMPFVPLLELLHIPEAVAASQTMVVGFADMFIPAILATSIESDMTRFVIAALSVTQLIYMSEVGALLLGSKIPVNIIELFVIFLMRTLVTLPVIALVAHWVF